MSEAAMNASAFDAVALIVLSSWEPVTPQMFPVNPKHPHIEEWPTRATDNLQTLKSWWTQWPRAMIGVTTGEPSGFWTLDIDNKNGG